MGYQNGLGTFRQVSKDMLLMSLNQPYQPVYPAYHVNSLGLLLNRNAGENKFLREEIVYSSKSYYYFAIIEDFVLRFGWAVSLSLTEMGFSMWGDLITSILSPLEVFRRFVWNFFRLENEHLNNCGK